MGLDFNEINKIRREQRLAEIGQVKEVLARMKELATRVPADKFQKWSYQRTLDYKKICAECLRMVRGADANRFPTLVTARSVLKEIEGYWHG